jgi:hydroxymethylglutaryl-CoA reductase
MLVIHVLVDCRDAMGANLVNTVAERIAPTVLSLAGGRMGCESFRICRIDGVRVRVSVPMGLVEGP